MSQYDGTPLEGTVDIGSGSSFPDERGYQRWTFPAGGTYTIQAAGASGGGGNAGGGALIQGDFVLGAGDRLVTLSCTVSPYSTTHPKSFLAGGVGGYYSGTGSYGGFGGSSAGHSGGGMAGGGGYSGGGSDGNGYSIPQGGGSSFNAGSNQENTAGTVRLSSTHTHTE